MGSQVGKETSVPSSPSNVSSQLGDDPRSPSSNFTRTPVQKVACIDDPRSPSINVTRTPVHKLESFDDPRSPTMRFARTPVYVASQRISQLDNECQAIKFTISDSEIEQCQQEESYHKPIEDNVMQQKATDTSLTSGNDTQDDNLAQRAELTESVSGQEKVDDGALSLGEDVLPKLATLHLDTSKMDDNKQSKDKQEVIASRDSNNSCPASNQQAGENTEGKKKKKPRKKQIQNENIGVDKMMKGKILYPKLANGTDIPRSPLKDSQNSPFVNRNKNQRRLSGLS
ncbi:uncharacterized protein TRIADDRAFT_54748 [Trichoplax adhaerens]|uniref:Uncharacterized protein n=1 Tax=Trichoplax adhaerens TaxID=10228 RepID=B3RSW0_TRIAD|nr:predicted protein [Trichoplax adhaerens]EDV27116.1 predicted protein [Trichoplax adhaerens]|eukprot:XP_002111112.1 predicted protein [Trichoplax adhaerens]